MSCLSDSYHAWAAENHVGVISRSMQGTGTATLTFGNCWNAGVVNVYLGSTLIATAQPNTNSETVTFDFTNGQLLELKDESGNAVVSMTKMAICRGELAHFFS